MSRWRLCALWIVLLPLSAMADLQGPDLIVCHGKIVTVDPQFSIAQAMAVKDGKIALVGNDDQVLATKTSRTVIVDLARKTVLPGLIDSHVHPSAAMTEFDHPVPEMCSTTSPLAPRRSAKVSGSKFHRSSSPG
jgi:hypothetical protein